VGRVVYKLPLSQKTAKMSPKFVLVGLFAALAVEQVSDSPYTLEQLFSIGADILGLAFQLARLPSEFKYSCLVWGTDMLSPVV
jgi:hypothetical protein